ncbi:MAG: LemA family protein [Saprospiraceae bacterium]|nr:LemA family protein [Saprospiraceae bacterium]
MTQLAILILSVLFLSLLIGWSYNSFIHRKNALQYAYQSMEVMLQKRHELLPKLAEVVQASAEFEFRLIQEANNLLQQPNIKELPPAAMVQQENQIARSITQITSAINRDASLRQRKSFVHLQKSIVEVEAQISASRRAYNAAVMEYNNAIEMFPTAVFASMLKLQRIDPVDLVVLEPEYAVKDS